MRPRGSIGRNRWSRVRSQAHTARIVANDSHVHAVKRVVEIVLERSGGVCKGGLFGSVVYNWLGRTP